MILVQNLRLLLNGNNLIIKILTSFILIFNLSYSSAQYVEVLKKENGVFYIHTVVEGNTIYGIQGRYGCDAEELLKANPGIERGLVNGTVVFVPVKRSTVSHTVQKQETLFGLSKLYDVSVDSIINQNPSAENGLKIDQKLTIRNAVPRKSNSEITNPEPQPIVDQQEVIPPSFTDTIIEYTVLPQETMYTIAKRFMIPVQRILDLNQLSSSKVVIGQKVKVPIKKENLLPIATRTPDKTNPSVNPFKSWGEKLPEAPTIAILLPLNLDSVPEINKNISNYGIDYYIGIQMALDSLEKYGFTAKVKVIDYIQKGKDLISILNAEKLSTYDLIFAPFDKKEAEILHSWSLGKDIHIVYATTISPSMVKNNPLALTYSTTNEQLIIGMAKYLRKTSGRVVLIKNEKSDELWMQNTFSSAFRMESLDSDFQLIEATWKNYKQFEQIGGEIYFVYLSNEKEKVITLLSQYQLSENFHLVGLKEWTEWKEVNSTVNNKFKFQYAAPNQFDYEDENIKLFHRKFRNAKQADLNKTICLGYDVTRNVLQFIQEKTAQQGIVSSLYPVLRNNTDGYENTATVPVIFEYFKSRNLIK
jgi:LysM repeat protein